MTKEILFDDMTARDVAERLRLQAEIQSYINAVALTVARMNGAGAADTVSLNRAGTGIVIASTEISGGGDDGEPVTLPAEAAAMARKREK